MGGLDDASALLQAIHPCQVHVLCLHVVSLPSIYTVDLFWPAFAPRFNCEINKTARRFLKANVPPPDVLLSCELGIAKLTHIEVQPIIC